MEQSINWLALFFHIACAYAVYGLKKGEVVARCRAAKTKLFPKDELTCLMWMLLAILVSCVNIIGPLAVLGIVLIPMKELHWAWATPQELRPNVDDEP